MARTVEDIIQRVKLTLLEAGAEGVRWTNAELLGWLNESYEAITGLRPDASAVAATLPLVAGTRQAIPAGGERLLDVKRNVAADSAKGVVRRIDRKQLDDLVPGWHAEQASIDIEHYVFNENDPASFYTYPPALATAEVEAIYSVVPAPHTGAYDAVKAEAIKLGDSYAPSMVDYILFRAFSKDADSPMYAQRATLHYQVFTTQLGVKSNVARAASPNPQRAQ